MIYMNKIEEVLNKFQQNLKHIDQLGEIGTDASDILLGILDSLKRENEFLDGFMPYKGKLDNAIEQVKTIKDHSSLKEKYNTIYNQSVVLIIASFESFMNDLVRDLIDFFPEVVNWPDKKQISFDPNILKYSSPTLGSLIVKSSLREKYNFQDLQPVLDFLKDYLKIELNIENDLKEKLIKYEALRHVIIHNSAKIDEKFKKQIREMSYSNNYDNGDDVKLIKDDYLEARNSFSELAEQITKEVVRITEVKSD